MKRAIATISSPLTLASLLDISGNGVRDELVDDLLEVGGANLPLDDVDHLLPDVLHLGALGVAGLLGGQILFAGEPNAEQAEHVAVSCLHVNIALHQGLPLLHHGPQLVGGEVHAVEGSQAVLALNILHDQLELPEGSLGVILVLKISEGHLEDATFESLRSDLGSGSSVHQSLANLTDLEDTGGLDVIPANKSF